MLAIPKRVYTAEYSLAAVQQVNDGQGVAVAAREPGIPQPTLRTK